MSYADYRFFSLPPSPCLDFALFVFFVFHFTLYLLSSPSYCASSVVFCTSPHYHPFVLLLCPPAQCAFRWVRLHWDAEQLSQPVQLQPASGFKGQEPVFGRE